MWDTVHVMSSWTRQSIMRTKTAESDRYRMLAWIASAKLGAILDIVNPRGRRESVLGKMTSFFSSDSHKARKMQHVYDVGDDDKLLSGDLEPHIQSVNKELSNTLTRRGGQIGVGSQEGLQ